MCEYKCLCTHICFGVTKCAHAFTPKHMCQCAFKRHLWIQASSPSVSVCGCDLSTKGEVLHQSPSDSSRPSSNHSISLYLPPHYLTQTYTYTGTAGMWPAAASKPANSFICSWIDRQSHSGLHHQLPLEICCHSVNIPALKFGVCVPDVPSHCEHILLFVVYNSILVLAMHLLISMIGSVQSIIHFHNEYLNKY